MSPRAQRKDFIFYILSTERIIINYGLVSGLTGELSNEEVLVIFDFCRSR